MPNIPPPAVMTRTPSVQVVKAGTTLWRTHPSSTPAVRFDVPRAGVFGGRRFDGTSETGYGYLYASPDRATAIAEQVLPDLDANPYAPRILHRSALSDLVVSAVTPTADLSLVRLTSAVDLANVHQDSWLITERDGHYPAIREWVGWMRAQAPWAQGITWTSMVDLPNTTMVLFADRCSGLLRELPDERLPFGAPEPAAWLTETLAPWGVETRPARRRDPVIFLNYRSGYGDGAVLLLHDELVKRFGEDAVFRDVMSIPPGEPFADLLLRNAGQCKVMLTVVGPNWETAADPDGTRLLTKPDDWVRREIVEALANDVTVVPVLVGHRLRVKPGVLPAELAHVAQAQYLTLGSDAGRPEASVLVEKLINRRPELNDYLREQ